MKTHNTPLALAIALKELRHGWKHFAVFLACLTLGVTIMASVNTFGFLVENSLRNEAQSLLGGDLEIRIRGVEASTKQREFFEQYGKTSYVTTMRAMLHAVQTSSLVEIKAIDESYPLLGALEFNEAISRDDIFKGNGVAVDPTLFAQLNLKLGDTIKLGEGSYVIRATIKTEPDRAVQLFNFGPRVMLSHTALEASKLVNTFSLIEHRYRIDTPQNIIANEVYEKQVEDELAAAFPNTSWRVSTGTDGNQTLKSFIEQLLAFLNLSGLATFLIAGIGIASSVRAYLEKKSQTIAVLKVQGASRSTILQCYAFALGFLSLVGGVIGMSIAGVTTLSLMPFLVPILPILEGQSGIYFPASLLALWYGFLIAYLFSMPALLSALDIRPAILFRSKMSVLSLQISTTTRKAISILGTLLLLTMVFSASDAGFILVAIAIILVSFFLFYLCAMGVRTLTRRIKVKTPWLRLALGNMHRPGSTTGTVIFAIGISLTVLIALTLTETNFQQRIESTVQEKAPSLFLIDIQPHQKQGVENLLREYESSENVMLLPMVRGRIAKIKGIPTADAYVSEDVDWAVRNDRGLSYSAKAPTNSTLIAGEWWDETYTGKPLLSVDERFLEGMDVKIGDTMTLNVLGKDIEATIANARQIDYTSFQINFAMVLSPGHIESFPHTTLATIHLKDHTATIENELVNRLIEDYPGVTVIRTKKIVELVREIMQHIATALRITVAISLIAGLLVLASALSATIEQRMYDTAMLKVLGARQSDILKCCTAEWMFLALVTAMIAAVIGTFSAWLIINKFPGQDFYLMPEVTLTTIISCFAVIWVIGYLGNRRLFRLRPASLLRNE